MITVYTGNGKGKTTSAVGEALFGIAQGKRVIMIQFLKGSTYSGEITGLYRLGVPLVQFGVGCRWSGMIRTGLKHCTACGDCFRQNRDPVIAQELIQQALDYLQQILTDELYDIIVLDEISHALNKRFLQITILKDMLSSFSGQWILTGRQMPEELLDIADFWWEMKAEKHPFQAGIKSRRGIEY